MFGVGGAEWLIIGGIIVLLFVPSAAFFAIGYFVGKRTGSGTAGAGAERTETVAPSQPGDDDV